MKFKYLSILIVLVFIGPETCFAQFKMEDFLATSNSDLSLAPTRAKLNFLSENNFNGPWISRVEFRTRSNDADFSQEDFRLRFTPANPGELKANKRYYTKQVDLLNLEYREELNKSLKQRYIILIDHLFEFEKVSNLKKQLEINHRLTNMMNSGNAAYSMDLGDLIDAESNELDMTLSIENSKIKLDEIEFLIKDIYKFEGDIDWAKEDVMEVEDILNLFAQFKNHPSGEHIYLTRINQKNILAAEKFHIEKSETLRNIGYFQAEYDTDRGNETSEHFGYQIGIRIPIVNPDKPDLNRRKLALMDDEAILEEKRDDHQREMELAVLRMDHFTRQYGEINNKLESIGRQNHFSFQSPDKSIKISDLIKLNEFYLDLLFKQNAVKKLIYETYLNYLDLSGKISEVPLRNYLSKNLTEF